MTGNFNFNADKELQALKKTLGDPQDPSQITDGFAKLATLEPAAQAYVTGYLEAGLTLGIKSLRQMLPAMRLIMAAEAADPTEAKEFLEDPAIKQATQQFRLEAQVVSQLVDFRKGDVTPEISNYARKLAANTDADYADPLACLRAMISAAETTAGAGPAPKQPTS